MRGTGLRWVHVWVKGGYEGVTRGEVGHQRTFLGDRGVWGVWGVYATRRAARAEPSDPS